MIQYTSHSAFRAAQRGLSKEEIEYVLQFGSCYHRGGALIYYLRRQDIPLADVRKDWITSLVGTALIFSRDGSSLMTVWRNRRCGLKRIRKQRKYNYKCYIH